MLEGFKGFALKRSVFQIHQPNWQMPFSEQDQSNADELLGTERLAGRIFVISPAAIKRAQLAGSNAMLSMQSIPTPARVSCGDHGWPTPLEVTLSDEIIATTTRYP